MQITHCGGTIQSQDSKCGFMVGKLALRQVFLYVFWFSTAKYRSANFPSSFTLQSDIKGPLEDPVTHPIPQTEKRILHATFEHKMARIIRTEGSGMDLYDLLFYPCHLTFLFWLNWSSTFLQFLFCKLDTESSKASPPPGQWIHSLADEVSALPSSNTRINKVLVFRNPYNWSMYYST